MEQTNTAPKRPTFLTVLCILTWIGSVFGIIGLLMNKAAYAMAEGMSEGLSSMAEKASNVEGGEAAAEALSSVSNLAANYNTYMYIGFACILLCIVGSVMMWQLKKMGYYIYVAGELIAPISMIVLLGSSSLAGLMAIAGLIFPILFVVLYGLNLKHMK